MKTKQKIFYVFFCLFLLAVVPTYAQIFDKLKDKAKEKANEAIDKATQPKNNNSNTQNSSSGGQNNNNMQNSNNSSGNNTLIDKVVDREASEEEIEAAVEKFFYEVPSQFPTSFVTDRWERKIGRIVFSKKPISYGKEEKDAITNTFKAGDQVFGMAYLSDTKKNLGFENGYKIWIHDTQDGSGYSCPYDFDRFEFPTNEDGTNNGDQKFYDLDVFVSEEEAWDKHLTKYLLQFLTLHLKGAPKSPYGVNSKKVHRLAVQISGSNGLVAKGIFDYDLTSGHEKMYEMYDSHVKADLKEFKLPASERNDEALAAKIKKVMVGHGVNVQKVVFSSADWGLIRHEISGAILQRSIWAYVVYKNEKGECHYDEVQFVEDYIGNAFSGVVKKAGYGTANGQILCENVK